MISNKLYENKKKYAISKHHAWAGSILLAILLAVRVFLEISEINVDDRIILFIGAIILIYMLIALVLTYKYRSSLIVDEKPIQVNISTDIIENKKINSKIEKERLKAEKKKAKEEVKKIKKSQK